jgi:isoleucyl-tRNA synthetase
MHAQGYETDFREGQRLFQERAKSTQDHLKEHLLNYPHTPYSDEVYLMQGVLYVEKGKYKTWKEKGYFTAGDMNKKPFSMVIPPPNVTGKLHLGHAWDTTIQDIITRYKKAKGFDVLWLPGMDHAGIATQAKVMERLRKEGVCSA